MRIRFKLRHRAVGGLAIAAIACGCLVRPGRAAAAGEQTFVQWAAAHAVPITTLEPDANFADLQALRAVIGSARVVALGEPAHGAHEPLAFRNRLFRYLVEDLGFTAIALESGFPESRRLYEYVAGGPGEARRAVRKGLTWGFGRFQENVDLVRWMHAYNADPVVSENSRWAVKRLGDRRIGA